MEKISSCNFIIRTDDIKIVDIRDKKKFNDNYYFQICKYISKNR